MLNGAGLLKSKKIGIIRQDLADQQEVTDDALVPGIKALGYTVAAEAVLPRPEGSQTCEQQTVAIQRMQDAGVNVVFLVAQTLAGSATVQAAQTLGYKPQWMTIGNNVTNTVAKFYANAKQNYDGAYGLDINFTDTTPAAASCNQIAAGRRRREVPARDRRVRLHRGDLHPDAVLGSGHQGSQGHRRPGVGHAALQQLQTRLMLANPSGSVSQQKHYAGTSVFISRYSAGTQTFQPVDNQKPIVIAP